MKTGRNVIISAILALGAAGSILAGSAAIPAVAAGSTSAVVAYAPNTHVYG